MQFYTYILFSKSTNRYYIGSTNNLERRINEHNSRHTTSTRNGIPWELVYSKEFDSKSDAIKLELKIKRMKSRKFIERLIDDAVR